MQNNTQTPPPMDVLNAKVKTYVKQLTDSTLKEIVSDFQEFRLTPATVVVSLTTIAAIIVVARLFGSSNTPNQSRPKKKKKKLTKAQRANNEIQAILDHVEEVYVKEIEEFLNNFSHLTKDEMVYKYKYFEEMLLKELMKLDGIDVSDSSKLRENRKKVIKFVQDHQKRLDQFKEEALF
ncbi:uncharacterized protein KQ657_000647 [Scheffersomyces spartinae]|uniref:BAG domain-containing protein n=1 Tax=Scheffersomyces spartinae TaxID=45513 RepID=A0A9P7V946_9ASCO|nr:uncharacterized protein KQ657_000647 [Scheffersomyces spartinae]KAG7193578.1 hypothetical protein KQ657_000647 [Scheffersomyces spartinae]